MAEEVKTSAKFHNIILENRGRLNVSGVEDVDSFDEGAIIIFTNMGVLTVRGEDLHIHMLDLTEGTAQITGVIHSLMYVKVKEKGDRGFLAKLMK